MSFSTFFSKLQESPWYRQFLNPVIDEIPPNSRFLDIGTGSGKLLKIVNLEKNVTPTGVDTNADMLKEAKDKLGDTKATLLKIKPNEKMPFEDGAFDSIAICSVLFHLSEEDIHKMLDESRRLLTQNGKIIILTPTGKGSIVKLARYFSSWSNRGIFIWYSATKKRAKLWGENKHLAAYCAKYNLHYKQKITLKGFAVVETISN